MAAEEDPNSQQQRFLQYLRYIVPAVVFAYFWIAKTISACTLQNLKASSTGPRKVLLLLASLLVFSFLVESCMLLIDTAFNGARYSSTDSNIHALFSVLVWTVLTLCLLGAKDLAVWYPYSGSWFIGLVGEAILFALILSHGVSPSAFVHVQVAVQACRMLILVLLSTSLFTGSCKRSCTDEESASLLRSGEIDSDDKQDSIGKPGYGSITITPDGEGADLEYEAEQRKKEEKRKEMLEKRLQSEGNWFTYAKAYHIFIPYLLPAKDRVLQAKLLGVCLCLLCTRALNLLEPRQLGIVVDQIGMSHMPIVEVSLWVVYRWADSSIISQVKYILWLPLEQYGEGSLKKAAYNHIMGLSRDFHTEKRSGELYTSIGQGRSLQSIVEALLFRVVPMLIDLIVAFVYLCWIFGPYLALIVAVTTVIFLWTSAYFVEKQTEPRRRLTGLSRKEHQVMYDTVGGWTSVVYFNRREHEQDRYAEIVGLNMRAHTKFLSVYYLSWVVQDTIIELGMICACILALYQISNGAPIGNFVMLVAYWGNFTGKLTTFAEIPRKMIQDLIDAEAMLDLFQKKPTVKEGNTPFVFKQGAVHFRGVKFSYDGEKEIIKDFNFHAKPGQKVALVGETGGGKSTILRLLFRFYDVQEGSIMVDDQDLRDVTLASLRGHIGVVPQDPSLFNESIMENVRYARLDATDEDVMEACKAASIHEKILTFSKGYATRVGENGVVLSGGELQRVAIARVILKNPRIILLDEATSCVDTETETHITNALQLLSKDRTTFTVAHRLSTVKSSDIILVIKDGVIAERGSPRELLDKKGEFSKLWLQQMEIKFSPTGVEPVDVAPVKLSGVSETSSGEENRRSSESSGIGTKNLRATAPDFVPRSQRGISASGAQVRTFGTPLGKTLAPRYTATDSTLYAFHLNRLLARKKFC
ncbi:hypothetical protein BDR22DRAFT_812779 [Usnea florida]